MVLLHHMFWRSPTSQTVRAAPYHVYFLKFSVDVSVGGALFFVSADMDMLLVMKLLPGAGY